MIAFPLVKYALLASIRDRLVLALVGIFFLGSCLALFLGSASVIEKDQFTVVFAAGGLRLIGVLGLVLFVIFFIRRSFEGKEVEFLLSRPVGRVQLLLSFSAAFSLLAIIISLSIGLCVFALSPHLFGKGHLLWIISITIENIIMVNIAMFFAMYISSAATAALATSGFYILARMSGQLLGIVDSHIVDSTGPSSVVVQFVSVFIPRLDLLGQTTWLLSTPEFFLNALGISLLQGFLFCVLVISAALLDLVRRQF